MLDEAIKKLERSLELLNPRCQIFDEILEALSLVRAFNESFGEKVIDFVMEHYTTEQIVKRCGNAVILAFAKDYIEFMNGKKGVNDV